ncbi:universal stress protein [Pseudaeromonas pectinilytica]|jgi:Universal stress protein UspA and related nucleotide-binding proteins
MNGQTYQHILVAIDLRADNHPVLDKAIALAKTHSAKLSVIHVDVDLREIYTEMIDIDIGELQDHALTETRKKMEQVLAGLGFPLEKKLVISGDLGEQVNEAIARYGIDLLVCGHHQNFWSLLISSARQLMNQVECDMLVVPIKG